MRLSQSSSSIGGVDVCVGVRSLIFPRRERFNTSRRSATEEQNTMSMKNDAHMIKKTDAPMIAPSSLSPRKQLSGGKRRSNSACTRMQHEEEQCERRGASEEFSSRGGAESPQEERNCDTSVDLSPPLFFGRAPAGPPAAFVPRRELRAGPPPVFRTHSDNQDKASGSMRDLMIPFSHQGAQAEEDAQAADDSADASMSMLTNVLLQNVNSNNQSLLFTGQEQPIFNSTKAVAMLTDGGSPTCIKPRSNLTILPRSSRSASLDQAPPSSFAPFSRAPIAFVVGTNTNRSQRTTRDQGIFRSPVARGASAVTEQVTMEQALSWTEELGQHTPKAGVQCNSWTNLKVPQHKINGRAAPLAPRPQPQFFQTPSQMQSSVPFSAWDKTTQTKQLQNLSFPSLGMEDGDDDIDCEMRDCDIWNAMGGDQLSAAKTDANAEPRDKTESPDNATLWADLALKASRSGSLLKSPTV